MLDGYWCKFRASVVSFGLAMIISSSPGGAETLRLFTIGAGDVSGGYYASAQAICEVVNRAERGRLRCSPDPTQGSIYNLNALRKKQLDFAIVQSDWHRAAFEGTGLYARDGRFEDLRSVLSLFKEPITILARRGAGIYRLADLVGKRIDIGHPASGRRATVERLFAALALTPEKFAKVAELSSSGALDDLCAGALDATILVVGHPNARIGRVLATCDADLIPIAGPQLAAALEGQPDYSQAVIPKSHYPELSADISTYAVTATLVTRATVEADIVQSLVQHALDQRAGLAQRAPVLNDLDPRRMRRQGLTAPLHPGAKAAFDKANVVGTPPSKVLGHDQQ
jgi:TRAP transporter TAXI family solute receptor